MLASTILVCAWWLTHTAPSLNQVATSMSVEFNPWTIVCVNAEAETTLYPWALIAVFKSATEATASSIAILSSLTAVVIEPIEALTEPAAKAN